MSSKKKNASPASYPKQAAPSYPVQQGAYPVQATYAQPNYYAPQPQAAPYDAPPAQQYPYGSAPQYGNQPPPYAPPGYQPQPQPVYLGVGQFDAGARFDSTSTANVPPPPPGCAPNAAQFAMMQGGQAVVNSNRSTNFLWGSDGGVSWNF